MTTIAKRDYATEEGTVSISLTASLNGWYFVIRDSSDAGIGIEGGYNTQAIAEAKFNRIIKFYEGPKK
jgi:hypothetical protein